jgi:hypothetical protein
MGPLFGSAPASQQGWAAWYVAPVVAAALGLALHYAFVVRPKRTTVAAMAIAGCGMALLGVTIVFLVKNIGYTWYFVPGATILAIVSVVVPMTFQALGNAVATLADHPLLLPAAGSVAALAALLLRLPLRALHAPALPPRPTAEPAARPEQEPRTASKPMVFLTAFVMALFAAFLALAGGLVIGPLAGLVWLLVSFRSGVYSLRNVAIGSAVIGALTTLPLVMGSHFISATGSLYLLIQVAVLKFPILFIVSIALIRAAVALSPREGAESRSAAT